MKYLSLNLVFFLNMITLSIASAQNFNDCSDLKVDRPKATNISQNIVIDESIEIGDHRKMYLSCKGTGFPTVVLISGRSDSSNIWQTTENSATSVSVFNEISKFTHVCAYDRPGTIFIKGEHVTTGRSTSVKQPTTPQQGVKDLHALLSAAQVPGPYVLVGHSYGGLIARLYASTYPNDVVGLVLVDSLTELLYDILTPSDQKSWITANSQYSPDLDKLTVQERVDFIRSFREMHEAQPLRSIPVTILTSDEPYNFKDLKAQGVLPLNTPEELGKVVFQAHLLGQKHLAHMLKAKHITNTHSGHYIQVEQPQLVIEAIRSVIGRKE